MPVVTDAAGATNNNRITAYDKLSIISRIPHSSREMTSFCVRLHLRFRATCVSYMLFSAPLLNQSYSRYICLRS